ncbi:MAG: T9SS type A sorting domain-containing protein [Gammaproteobacteria bacterium]|nr:T9SS type A sorting domain-containing protein [Gammaproteobacteria bacterium]
MHAVADQDGDIFLLDVNNTFIRQQMPPVDFSLSQNYPNPFNPVTNIRFSIPDAGNVNLFVYNMLGEKVKTLVDGHKSAGVYHVEWDGTNSAGQKMVSGIYFYKLQMGSNVHMKKMLFMK